MSELTRWPGLVRTYGRWARFALLAAGLMLSGCAYGNLNLARDAFYRGDIAGASQALIDADKISSRDLLLYYMEKGAILHYSGNYEESVNLLLKASSLIEEQEIISASQQTVSLVTSEWLMDYKGEYAERLLVHTFQMMNFLILGRNDSALVEAKQALKVYDAYPEACNGDYFTRALVAHCFESVGEINGAYIEYKKLAELMGDPGPVAGRLCDLGARLGFFDEVEHFRKYLSQPDTGVKGNPVGEMLFFVSQGRAPVKIPQDIILPEAIRFSFFAYEDRGGSFPGPDIGTLYGMRGAEWIVTDVGSVLRASLNQRLLQIMAKETARVIAKQAIANSIGDSDVEAIVRIAFLLMEAPDTRCWETLPGSLIMVRVPLYPGDSPVQFSGTGIHPPPPPDAAAPSNHHPFYRYYSIRN
ncbi:MAG: hypothetical protein AB1724_14960 [Thermodesulfobacteriota bacterium]